MVGGDVAEGAGVEDGEDAVFADGVVDGLDEVLFREGALGEELFHELVFFSGDELDESFVRGLGFGFERRRGWGLAFHCPRWWGCRGRLPW